MKRNAHFRLPPPEATSSEWRDSTTLHERGSIAMLSYEKCMYVFRRINRAFVSHPTPSSPPLFLPPPLPLCLGFFRFPFASLLLFFCSVKVAHEKIRHLEAEAKGLLLAAEFREREASSMQEGANLALERAQAHERALASALEQVQAYKI